MDDDCEGASVWLDNQSGQNLQGMIFRNGQTERESSQRSLSFLRERETFVSKK